MAKAGRHNGENAYDHSNHHQERHNRANDRDDVANRNRVVHQFVSQFGRRALLSDSGCPAPFALPCHPLALIRMPGLYRPKSKPPVRHGWLVRLRVPWVLPHPEDTLRLDSTHAHTAEPASFAEYRASYWYRSALSRLEHLARKRPAGDDTALRFA